MTSCSPTILAQSVVTLNGMGSPTQTPRTLLAMGAAALGHQLRVWAVPMLLLRPLGLFYRFATEVADVGFTWDRPYVVDRGKFARRFDFAITPVETGVPATVHAFDGGQLTGPCAGRSVR